MKIFDGVFIVDFHLGASDYSGDLFDTDNPVFFDRDMNAITTKDVNSTCCRASKMKCRKVANNEKSEEQKSCNVQLGKILCEKAKRATKKIQTCLDLKAFARKKSRQQERANRKKSDKSSRKKTYQHKETKTSKKVHMHDAGDSEDEMDENEEEEYDDTPDNSAKTKHMSDISRADLVKIVKQLNVSKRKEKKNPKCKEKKSMFR